MKKVLCVLFLFVFLLCGCRILGYYSAEEYKEAKESAFEKGYEQGRGDAEWEEYRVGYGDGYVDGYGVGYRDGQAGVPFDDKP